MQAFVCRRGWRSHRHATSVVRGRISSRPKTVVKIPAMWKVLDETCGGGLGYACSTGLGVAFGMIKISVLTFVQVKGQGGIKLNTIGLEGVSTMQ